VMATRGLGSICLIVFHPGRTFRDFHAVEAWSYPSSGGAAVQAGWCSECQSMPLDGWWARARRKMENNECPLCGAGPLPGMTICLSACEQCASAVGETVPSVGAGTRLRLRARCSGSNIGRRSPWVPATRKGSPGVESPTARGR